MNCGHVCGDCRDKGVTRDVPQVSKGVTVGEPDYDARRKQELIDYGCSGKVAGIMRQARDYR